MSAINEVWTQQTQYWMEMNTPNGRYRFDLWADGWRMYRIHAGRETIKTQMSNDEMVNAIKLLGS